MGSVVQTLTVVVPLALVAAVTVAGLWMGVRGVLTTWPRRRTVPDPDLDRTDADVAASVSELRKWAGGRRCAMCGTALDDAAVSAHHIAIMEPGGGTREWTSVAPDALSLALATCLPVCWNCHIAETFRRKHPELVTERDDRVVHVK